MRIDFFCDADWSPILVLALFLKYNFTQYAANESQAIVSGKKMGSPPKKKYLDIDIYSI